MRLAPEGVPFVGAALAVWVAAVSVGLLFGGMWWLALAAWTPIAVWIPVFFRDPQRSGPRGDRLVIAPADGKIVSITELDDDAVIGGPATRISIFMNVFNVHVNRHPVSGSVVSRDYHPGAFVNATLDKASVHNERCSLGVRSAGGPIRVTQIAGLVARRIVTDPHVGDTVRQGDRLGLIRFGSRVDTVLPRGARPRVRVGDRTRAGETCIAEFDS